MKDFDFYDFVALVVPGSVLLVAAGYLLDVGAANVLFSPQDFGSLGVHLILAFVAGHLLQAIGNAVEHLYWKAWRGMPTDWPISRPQRSDSPAAKAAVEKLCGQTADSLSKWRNLLAQARSTVYSSGRSGRLHIFNGNYGMFRGLVAAELVIAVFAWKSSLSLVALYVALAAIVFLTMCRMHRFALHYAKELFANVAELARTES